jgi:hypothetical protein
MNTNYNLFWELLVEKSGYVKDYISNTFSYCKNKYISVVKPQFVVSEGSIERK